MRILNDRLLFCIALVLASSVSSILANLGNGINSYAWQLTTIFWIFNFWRVAKVLDEINEE